MLKGRFIRAVTMLSTIATALAVAELIGPK